LAAVERLRLAGLPVELDLIENISREKALERYRQADIAVEQLLAGSYGTFAVELMAIGVPVICYIRNDLVGKYPQPPPIAIADPLTIDAVLQDLLARPSDWPAIARRGRAYVEQFHEARLLAQQAITTYRTLRQARNGPLVSAPLTAPQTSEARVGDAA
ncbi:MAG TPA: hypothetical protein VGR40_07425, partial [Candidatus Binatus sp.]|nr:hypothetical protein [Candidatus Binatus sp.]